MGAETDWSVGDVQWLHQKIERKNNLTSWICGKGINLGVIIRYGKLRLISMQTTAYWLLLILWLLVPGPHILFTLMVYLQTESYLLKLTSYLIFFVDLIFDAFETKILHLVVSWHVFFKNGKARKYSLYKLIL